MIGVSVLKENIYLRDEYLKHISQQKLSYNFLTISSLGSGPTEDRWISIFDRLRLWLDKHRESNRRRSLAGERQPLICAIACRMRLSEIGYGVPSCWAK
jgi:hypothetical protein